MLGDRGGLGCRGWRRRLGRRLCRARSGVWRLGGEVGVGFVGLLGLVGLVGGVLLHGWLQVLG